MIAFEVPILRHDDMDAAYIVPPFDVEAVFGAKRVKVKATFDGAEYRGSVVRMGGCYFLGITKELRSRIGKTFGDMVSVTLEPDDEEREVVLPDDFRELLERNPAALDFYGELSYTQKKRYADWISTAKKEETRSARLNKAIEMLIGRVKDF